jgi:hypothetical protein
VNEASPQKACRMTCSLVRPVQTAVAPSFGLGLRTAPDHVARSGLTCLAVPVPPVGSLMAKTSHDGPALVACEGLVPRSDS